MLLQTIVSMSDDQYIVRARGDPDQEKFVVLQVLYIPVYEIRYDEEIRANLRRSSTKPVSTPVQAQGSAVARNLNAPKAACI